LVSNSIRYTKNKGFIKINFNYLQKNVKGWLQVQVEDSGIGINEKDLADLKGKLSF
jgi:signal transduction histidine kinase